MKADVLIPIKGCWVRRPDGAVGRVVDHGVDSIGGIEVEVAWGTSSQEWVPLSTLGCGFGFDWTVQDVPLSATRRSLGQGRVVGTRNLGAREQVLVQLEDTGRSVWLPYENLRRIKDVRMRYVRAEVDHPDHAARYRLKVLAHALENWNHLTGSLDRLDVDPLPHQIQLVHRILSSGNYNWLIADDVGLGKTIEVGLLLAALKRKGFARRVLVVCPAGLTRQWQDELRFKFDEEYLIYGDDVTISVSQQWKAFDHIIVSIDRAKVPHHMDMIRQAGHWDVVVFDEGHKLTRHASGERAQRYVLAETLRPMSEAFLLLSGTPHQGYRDRFLALLELVRPDLAAQIHTIEVNPEVVAEMILRNRKEEVTDADGNLLFRGHLVRRLGVEPTETTRRFHARLRDYLVKGYKAGETMGAPGRAIGFVMTTYRKLASSSIAAIERALQLRLERLEASAEPSASSRGYGETSLEELAEGGDDQERLADAVEESVRGEFFEFERSQIGDLLGLAAVVRKQDEKLRIFLDGVANILMEHGKKLLVFTEYRATQAYLKSALENRFPKEGRVLLINGSMALKEKLEEIEAFNEGMERFLVSTEAGGEGLNLHRACHVMVNYDLPWNPARLMQRIGRLYRYGQAERVVVVNLHAQDSFDNQAICLMMDRVMRIAEDMAPVGREFTGELYTNVLGEVLERLDMAEILRSATSMHIGRTEAEIEKAIVRAREARELQDEILAHASRYDPAALRGTVGFTMRHVEMFVRAMLPYVGVTVEQELYQGRVLEMRLREEDRGVFPEFGQRTVVRVTMERALAGRVRDVALLDFGSAFFGYLVEEAKSQAFGGIYASVRSPVEARGVLAVLKLRWQNDQGDVVADELVALFRDEEGGVTANPAFFTKWLESTCESAAVPVGERDRRRVEFAAIQREAERLLATESTRFKHPNGMVGLAAADCDGGEVGGLTEGLTGRGT